MTGKRSDYIFLVFGRGRGRLSLWQCCAEPFRHVGPYIKRRP